MEEYFEKLKMVDEVMKLEIEEICIIITFLCEF